MLELCDRVANYHRSEAVKIDTQKQYFETIRRMWLQRQ